MASLTIQQAFDLALQHHQAGRLRQAEQLYRQILAQQPEHTGAIHYLGVMANQEGRNDIAVDLIRRAIALWPDYAEAYSNLGNALKDKGQFADAIAAYRQAIALRPNFPEAHSNLGNALRNEGQLDGAIAAYRQAIALRPNYAEAQYNLGNALKGKGQLDDAIAAYRRAIALKPNYAAAYYNLGNVLRDKGQLDEAIATYRQAIALRPNYVEAYSNLGDALTTRGQFEEAIAAFRQAINLNPDIPEVHYNLGTALIGKGQLDEAITAFRQAIDLRPNYAEAHNNLANVMKDKGQIDDAIVAYRQAMAVNLNDAKTHSNLVYILHFQPGYTGQQILEASRAWAQAHERPLAKEILPHANDPTPQRRLRIGYVSPDFRLHPVGRFLLPLLAHHHPQAFEITAYSLVRGSDAITDRLRSYVEVWQDLAGLSDAQAADQIRADGIDILVDLALHTGQNRLPLFCRKPAPVQATWLGYVGTTGLAAMDYRFSDPYLDPPGLGDEFYVEKTLRLPHCFWCYPPPDASPEVSGLPAAKTGSITFGCFNNFWKATAPTLDLWAALLRQIKGSRLVIHANAGSHQETLRRRFASAGVEGGRIAFVARQRMEDYFVQYGQIDIALDPFPYGGGTTTCDALWMGVPVVSLAGRTAMGRAGVSLLCNVGLPELIAQTPDQYLSIAGELVADMPRLAQLRRQLRPMMQASVLMDGPRFTTEMEAAYRQMWANWCKTAACPPDVRP